MKTRIREQAEVPLTLDELEKDHIRAVLTATRGNKRLAAELLGIDRRTLYRKLDRYQLRTTRKGELCAAASEA